MERKSLDQPDETRKFEGLGWADIVTVGGKAVARGHFQPGWRWSVNVKPIAGTELCEVSHLIYCLEGTMRVTMKDGSVHEVTKGDAVAVPPGHDAEVIGHDACVMVDFGEIGEYALRHL
ncbi:cupin [Rhizocola hellebori]|uniref:Cupin n=2 Tax=Rhizocola hellebori TaxID=1392758 RepID=A0A8J3VHF2_9ACTN|nr:cupin [Rhizocola hellebori]